MDIKSARLLLRPVTVDDLVGFHKLQSNVEVTKWTKHGPNKTLECSREMLDDLLVLVDMMKSYDCRGQPVLIHAITISPSNHLVGLIGTLRPREIGFSLHPSFWGQGYAQEATKAFCAWYLREHPGQCLFATVNAKNDAGVRCLRRCGFTPATEKELKADEAYGKDREWETWLLRSRP